VDVVLQEGVVHEVIEDVEEGEVVAEPKKKVARIRRRRQGKRENEQWSRMVVHMRV